MCRLNCLMIRKKENWTDALKAWNKRIFSLSLVSSIGMAFILGGGCAHPESRSDAPGVGMDGGPLLVVLGTAQDAGYPQAGCQKACCLPRWADSKSEGVSCIGLLDPGAEKAWMLEATPDFPTQLEHLRSAAPFGMDATPDGIFLTHAHMGHYSGLLFLGREAMGAHAVPVFAMPRMEQFLKNNGPWGQLVALKNIALHPLVVDSAVTLSQGLRLTPMLVPHRDEYSETVGYRIEGPSKTALFIPDIDKWERWDRSIVEEVKKVDYALLDATFFSEYELPGRNMAEIPHPFVPETIALFENVSPEEKAKIYFIHLNHTNPLLDPTSQASQTVIEEGFHIARTGLHLPL